MEPFWQFTRRMVAAHKWAMGLALLFACISAGGLGTGIMAVKPMMDAAFQGEQARSLAQIAQDHNAGDPAIAVPQWIATRLPTDIFDGLLLVVAAILVLTLIGAITSFLHQYISQSISTRMVAVFRQEAFERVLHLSLDRVVARGPSEYIARIVRDAAELQRGLIALVSRSVMQLTKGIAGFIAALCLNWKLTLISLVVAPILVFALRKIGKRVRRGTYGSLEAQQDLLRVSTETLQGLRAVKVNTAEPAALGRFNVHNDEIVRHELKIRKARALSPPLVESLSVVALLGLALIAARAALAGNFNGGEFILTFGALTVAGTSFRPLAGLVNEIQATGAPADRLADIMCEPLEPDAGTTELERHAKSIALDSITFRYPGADVDALIDVSGEIRHGARIAVVGPNGSGKTTLISLLPRLLAPSAGRIVIDDHDIATCTLHSVRSQIAVVTQETMLIRGTVAENIAFGRTGVSRSQIEDAARRAHAHEFIESLPKSYDADVAEQGASLSGGQRQRIAIARALLRDPSILVLDEATSQIDAESSQQIRAAIDAFAGGRTVLIIAHSLDTVRGADEIWVMDAGRLVARGTHAELVETCDVYVRMFGTEAGVPSTRAPSTPSELEHDAAH